MDRVVSTTIPNTALSLALVGGGLHNGLLALVYLARHPLARVTIFETAPRIGGNHTWCFYQSDCPDFLFSLLRPYLSNEWDGTAVSFPHRQRILYQPYYRLTGEGLAAALTDRQRQEPRLHLRLNCKVTHADRYSVTTIDGSKYYADVVVDSRGPTSLPPHDGAWQVFLGQHVRVAQPHGLTRPLVMDAMVDQADGLRFVYVLPLASDRLLIEDTYFVRNPDLPSDVLRARIVSYAEQRGFSVVAVLEEETGCLPLTTGETDPTASMDPIRGGYGGGWFHPVTGYSFPLAARFASVLGSFDTVSGISNALTRLSNQVAEQNRFFYWLNRMLYTGFLPQHQIAVLEHFYRVPDAVIWRFYSAALTPLDRMRMLMGRPPKHFQWSALPQSFRMFS